jgi:hypothetical protein
LNAQREAIATARRQPSPTLIAADDALGQRAQVVPVELRQRVQLRNDANDHLREFTEACRQELSY